MRLTQRKIYTYLQSFVRMSLQRLSNEHLLVDNTLTLLFVVKVNEVCTLIWYTYLWVIQPLVKFIADTTRQTDLPFYPIL